MEPVIFNGKKKSSKTELVPLSGYSSNTIFKENPTYTPQIAYNQSYFEWAAKYREQIFAYNGGIAGGSATLYTVPQGKVLFISAIWLTNYNSSAVQSTMVRVSTPSGWIISSFLPLAVAGTPNPHETLTLSYPVPLKIPAGTIITLVGNSTANSLTAAGFTGWLEYLEA